MGLSPRTLRPANNFTPKSITGLALWLDASDSSTLFQDAAATTPATATSDPVGAWLDKSGNARHATQSTGANRPSVSVPSGGTEMTNGKRAIYSAGSSGNGMGLGNISAAFPNSAGTAFFAYKVSSPTTSSGIDNAYSLAQSRFNNTNATNTDSGNEGFWRTTRLATYNSAALPRAGFGSSIYTIRSAAGEYTLRSKGAPFYTTATQDWNAGSDYWLWGDNANNMTVLGGWIGEAIFYNRALSASEVLRIERYLAAKWGITLAPQVSNADAQDWINRVYANGGTVSASTAAAVNTFCDAIDSAGIRDRFYRVGLFCGTGLNAALVPLYRNYRLSNGRNEIQGEAFGGWTLSSATVASSAAPAPAAAPAGAPLASSFKEATTASAVTHTMSFQYTATGAECVVSAYVKPDGRDWVLFSVEDAGGNPFAYAYYNLAGMVTGSAFSGATNSTITDAGNGWARVSFRCTPTAGTRFVRMFSSTANNANVTVGDATKGFLIWGFQLEYGTTLTAYDSRPLGNTTDTNVGPFVSGDYNEASGLKGNGSSKYLATGLPMTFASTEQLHLYASFLPDQAGFSVLLGARTNLAGSLAMEANYNAASANRPRTSWFGGGAQPANNCDPLTGRTQYLVNYDGSQPLLVLGRNVSLNNGNNAGSYSATYSTPFFVFAGEQTGTGMAGHTTHTIDSYSIGVAFTSSTQRTAFHNAMATFRAALGRT